MPLKIRLKEVTEEIKREASEALLQTGKDVFAISQGLVPVDTGALKQSGGVVPVSSERVVVGYGSGAVDYAKSVEYGTANSAAQPFLTPALVQAKSTFELRLKERLSKIK